jgi:hypothetical protein
MEYTIDKPATVSQYALHRIVADLTDGKPVSWFDEGKKLRIRTPEAIPGDLQPKRDFTAGQILGFQLKASCGKKVKGKHRYFHTADWRSRHEWLNRKGLLHGFEVLTVHCHAEQEHIKAGARTFSVDATSFTGVLKVTDLEKFNAVLVSGIGSTAKAFGFGFIQF